MSIPALQRRLMIMESSKRIMGYRALVSLEAMKGIRMMAYGQMAGKVDHEMLSMIEGQGSIHTASMGSMNSIYLMAHLHQILELDDVIRVAQDVCRIMNPQIIIFGCGSVISSCPPMIDDRKRGEVSSLSRVDLRIIQSLHYDARKPISAISKELELSPKTVRKHLNRMISDKLIEFRTLSSIEGLGALDFYIVTKIKTAESRPAILKKIRDDHRSYVTSEIVVSNARDLLFHEMETQSVNEMSKIVADIQALPDVESVSSDLIQKVYYFDIWRDHMLENLK